MPYGEFEQLTDIDKRILRSKETSGSKRFFVTRELAYLRKRDARVVSELERRGNHPSDARMYSCEIDPSCYSKKSGVKSMILHTHSDSFICLCCGKSKPIERERDNGR